MLRLFLFKRSLSLLLVFILSSQIMPGVIHSRETLPPVCLSPASQVQIQAEVVKSELAGTFYGMGVGLVTGMALTAKGKRDPSKQGKVASWRQSLANGFQRVRASFSQIDEQPRVVEPSILTAFFGPVFALFAAVAAIFTFNKVKISRRGFNAAIATAAATASTGCVTNGTDKVTDAKIIQPFDSKLPNTLNFDLARFLADAVKLNLGLRRVFFDYYLIDVVKPLADEGAGDIRVRASMSAVFNGSTTPTFDVGMLASGDFYIGSWNMAYQTHDYSKGDFKTQPANLLAAPIANDATGALNGINPELYYTIPLMGGETVANPDDTVKEAIRAKFRSEMNKIVHEVSQAYWQIVELKKDKLFLEQQKALIEALPEGERTIALKNKLVEIEAAIAATDLPIKKAYLVLMQTVGYRRDHFPISLQEVTIQPQESILLQFDEKNTIQVPLINESQSLERMQKNSIEYVRLTQQMNIAEEAIGAAKYNASRPSVTLAFGFEPRNAGLVGFLAEFRPLRFRRAEAQIMELRTKFLGYNAAKAEVAAGYEYTLANLMVDRKALIERIAAKEKAYKELDNEIGSARGYLNNSSGQEIAASELETNIKQARSNHLLTVAQIISLIQMLDAKRAFQSELRKFNHLESSRFVLEGLHVDDARTGQVLGGLKEYFDPYIHQAPIYFHNLFRGGVKMIWWLLVGFGTALATTLFPSTALAGTAKPMPPPAIRWSAPEFAPVSKEPFFAASI